MTDKGYGYIVWKCTMIVDGVCIRREIEFGKNKKRYLRLLKYLFFALCKQLHQSINRMTKKWYPIESDDETF